MRSCAASLWSYVIRVHSVQLCLTGEDSVFVLLKSHAAVKTVYCHVTDAITSVIYHSIYRFLIVDPLKTNLPKYLY